MRKQVKKSMEIRDIEAAAEAILFASGEPVSLDRIAAVLAVDKEIISDVADRMMDKYSYERRGIRLVRLENSLQLCSSPEYADFVRLALETRKPPQLTQPALEVLAVIAYFQPVTKAYIEQVRGVDSAYTVSLLQERGLVEPCGRLSVPGRPLIYGTTKNFLRTFGMTTLDELPPLPEVEEDTDGQLKIQNAISALIGGEAASSETNVGGSDKTKE